MLKTEFGALPGFKSETWAANHLWMVRYGALGCALTVYQLIHCKVLKIWEGGRGGAHAVVKFPPPPPPPTSISYCAPKEVNSLQPTVVGQTR
jgi:hypothetical protein